MSERGSFVTEYIYCSKCLDVLKAVLLRQGKYLCSAQIPSWELTPDAKPLPIIAGKVGGGYQSEEVRLMRDHLDGVGEKLCHPVKIVVITDGGQVVTIELG